MRRCVNIDWLEVYALESSNLFPCNADFFRERGWHVEEREYGTRVYRQMFTLFDQHGEPLFEIRRWPYSNQSKQGGIFPEESCHIRLHNRACYLDNPIAALREFMTRYDYFLVSIYRIDICLDFERFDLNDDPAKFIDRYMRGIYSKVNQANISAHGVDTWAGRTWNSLSWGNRKSMVSTKMYCKTLELEQEKDKPYIWYAWWQCGLIDDLVTHVKAGDDGQPYKPAIWRVEFSIKSSAKKVFVIDTQSGKSKREVMSHTLLQYDTKPKLLFMFQSLARHYFHFKHYEPDKRKDRCEDKILFKFMPTDTFFKIDRNASHKSMAKPSSRLLELVLQFKMTHLALDIQHACDVLINALNSEIIRLNMANDMTATDVQMLRALITYRMRYPNETIQEAQQVIADAMQRQQAGELF